MEPTVIRYTVKPEQAQRNADLIEGVFRELRTAPGADAVRYLVLRLADGTFIHVVADEGHDDVITGLPAFRAFREGGDERRSSEPVRTAATVVGNHRMLAP